MAVTEAKIHIIGVGSDGLAGLTGRARELLTAADLVVGADQTLTLLPEVKARKLAIGADLQEAVRAIENELSPSPQPSPAKGEGARPKRLVIVASGDPLFYGV